MNEAVFRETKERADAGDAEAQNKLGDYYYERKSVQEARRWYNAAAQQGYVEAHFNMGCVAMDQDGDSDAASWFRLPAEKGDRQAQYALALVLSRGKMPPNYQDAMKWCQLAVDAGQPDAPSLLAHIRLKQSPPQSSCIIATACLGESSQQVGVLRKLRDNAISSDPIARDFFHVFWSRYYEWSPGVARIAAQDPAVAEHIRWGFLDPWLAWLEFASLVGRRNTHDLSDDERRDIMHRLGTRLDSWLAELPRLMESKCPQESSDVFHAFDRFRASAKLMFSTSDLRG